MFLKFLKKEILKKMYLFVVMVKAKVLVVNSIWQGRLNKTALDFETRRFLRHSIASVDELHLKNKFGVLHLKRVDGKWTAIPARKDFKLDQNKVRELLTAIADAKAVTLENNKKEKNLKSLFTLELTMADKKWKAEVGQRGDQGIYADVSEPAFQMHMEPGALDKVHSISLTNLKEQPLKKKKINKPSEETTAAMAGEKENK